jgi:hypothetical protein
VQSLLNFWFTSLNNSYFPYSFQIDIVRGLSFVHPLVEDLSLW